MSVPVNKSPSPIQDYAHPDNRIPATYEITPAFINLPQYYLFSYLILHIIDYNHVTLHCTVICNNFNLLICSNKMSTLWLLSNGIRKIFRLADKFDGSTLHSHGTVQLFALCPYGTLNSRYLNSCTALRWFCVNKTDKYKNFQYPDENYIVQCW